MNENAKKVLVVVDMINGFINEGLMADPYINHITENIVDEIERTAVEDNDVIFVRDCHKADAEEFKTFPQHCIEGTRESEVIDELRLYSLYYVNILKNSTCALFAPGFIKTLKRHHNLEEIAIVGCCSDICVLNLAIALKNYLNENNLSIEISVYEDMVETYDSKEHNREFYNNMALTMMKNAGINIKSRERVRKNDK